VTRSPQDFELIQGGDREIPTVRTWIRSRKPAGTRQFIHRRQPNCARGEALSRPGGDVTGVGGVGKTRWHTGWRPRTGQVSGRGWLVEFAPVRDPTVWWQRWQPHPPTNRSGQSARRNPAGDADEQAAFAGLTLRALVERLARLCRG